MLVGHIATTLVIKRKLPQIPWTLAIVASMLNDIVMFTLVALGIEKLEPILGATSPAISNVIIDMTYSHDLLPQVFWVAIFALGAYFLTKDKRITLAVSMLVVFHIFCDLVSGYGHFVFGPDSHALGTDWYHSNLLAAVIAESILGFLCVSYYIQGQAASTIKKSLLYGVFILVPFSSFI